MRKATHFLALSLIFFGLSACGTTREAREAALLTEEQVVRLKAETARQEQLLEEQRAAASGRIERQLALQADLRDLIAERTTDWGDAGDQAGKGNLALLERLRAEDARLREDPFVLLTGEPLGAPSFPPVKADRSGLDKTLIGVRRLTGEERLALDDLAALAREVNDELARLRAEQEEAEAPETEGIITGADGS